MNNNLKSAPRPALALKVQLRKRWKSRPLYVLLRPHLCALKLT